MSYSQLQARAEAVRQGREVIGVVAGGPSGGLLSASNLDVPIGPGPLDPAGAVLGSGGITVLDDWVSPVEVVRRLAAYNASEACGKCTPCREGTKRMLDMLDDLADGKGKASDLDALRDMCDVVGFGSLCGLGQMAPGPVRSGLAHFREAFARGVGTDWCPHILPVLSPPKGPRVSSSLRATPFYVYMLQCGV